MAEGVRREQYRRFVEESPRRDDNYWFDEARPRFEPEPADKLLAMPGLSLERGAAGDPPRLVAGGSAVELPGCSLEDARAALAALPCTRSQLSISAGASAAAFVQATFGRVLFAPEAVAQLEVELSSLEIVRFPGSPYEVVRSYWRNMISLRRELEALATPSTAAAFSTELRRLHEIALLGRAGDGGRSSFYLPASALARKRPHPGELYEQPSVVEKHGAESVIVAGARVALPMPGGEHYFRLLAESVGDRAASSPERELWLGELSLGRTLQARAEHEAETRAWFLPPRPLTPPYFERLRSALVEADAAAASHDDGALMRALAGFHQLFVRLHPLPSANQSLSMSFVNQRLRERYGIGVPHLLLDQLALRFAPEAYARLFARAVRGWTLAARAPAARLHEALHYRRAVERLVSELRAASSLDEARLIALGRPEEAALALLQDGE